LENYEKYASEALVVKLYRFASSGTEVGVSYFSEMMKQKAKSTTAPNVHDTQFVLFRDGSWIVLVVC